MKNLILLLALLLIGLRLNAQTEEPKECSTRELILLDEKPTEVSKREAFYVITGEKERTFIKSWQEFEYASIMPPKWKKTEVKEYLYLLPGSSIPKWDPRKESVSSVTITNKTLIALWIFVFLFSITVGTEIGIAISNPFLSQHLLKWFMTGIIGNLVLGIISAGLYLVDADDRIGYEYITYNYDMVNIFLTTVGFGLLGYLLWTIHLLCFHKKGKDYRQAIKRYLFPKTKVA